MPRTALSEDDISAFRERICQAASHLFATEGYDAVTLRAIAAEVGCSPMTPYRYFSGGKDEIFALVRAQAFRGFAEAQEAAIAAIASPVEKLHALGVAYVDFAIKDPEAYRLMFELHQDTEASHPELEAEGLRAWLPMREAVAEAIEAGILSGDTDTLAHVFWAGVHGLVSLELAGKLKLGRDLASLVGPMQQSLFIGNATHNGLATIRRKPLAFGPPRQARRRAGRRPKP